MLCIGIGAVLLVFGFGLHQYRASPKYRAQQFVSALMSQNWNAIYDLSSPLQRDAVGLSRQQFVTLMGRICFQSAFSRAGPVFQIRASQPSRQYFQFDFDIKSSTIIRSEFPITVRRYDGVWYPDLNLIPNHMNRILGGDLRERRERLLNAMQVANVDRIVDIDNGLYMDQHSLEQAIKNDESGDTVWKR